MKHLFVFLFITFSTINSIAQYAELFRRPEDYAACLNSGKVSICGLMLKESQYVCGREASGFGWIDQKCSDTSKIEIKFYSQNNLKTTVKDIIYKCESFAQSGTVLGSKDVQIFELWNAGEVKNVTFTIPRISQTNSYSCYVKSWK